MSLRTVSRMVWLMTVVDAPKTYIRPWSPPESTIVFNLSFFTYIYKRRVQLLLRIVSVKANRIQSHSGDLVLVYLPHLVAIDIFRPFYTMAGAPSPEVLPAQDNIQTMFCDRTRSLEQFRDTLCSANLQEYAAKPVDEYNDIIRVVHGHQLSDGDLQNLRTVLETFKTKVEKADNRLLEVSTSSS